MVSKKTRRTALALYSSKTQTVVSSNVSLYTLWAGLLQRQQDSQLKSVAYASIARTSKEQNNAEINKRP